MTTWTDYLDAHDHCADALDAAVNDGWTLNAYNDPTADGKEDCSVEYAAEVAAEDPSLVYLSSVGSVSPTPRSGFSHTITCKCGAARDVSHLDFSAITCGGCGSAVLTNSETDPT